MRLVLLSIGLGFAAVLGRNITLEFCSSRIDGKFLRRLNSSILEEWEWFYQSDSQIKSLNYSNHIALIFQWNVKEHYLLLCY